VQVSAVAFPGPSDPVADRSTVAGAVDRFLDSLQAATTRVGYADTLARLIPVSEPGHPVAALEPEHYAAVMDRWDTAAAATWNRHLSALTSFTAWAQRQELLATNPARRLERRKTSRRGDRAIPRARLQALFVEDSHALRERVLWRMLYETAARTEEILSLNVEDLDPEFRRGRVISKGGAIEYVHWQTGTARLLPRLLQGRTSGPVFLSDRRAPTSGAPSAGGRRRLPNHRPGPPVLSARRVSVQDRLDRTRTARGRVDAAPAAPLGLDPSGGRRTVRRRAAG
jgi:integrase